MPTLSFVEGLGRAAKWWLRSTSPIRFKAVEALEVSTGYARPVIERALRNAFEELTPEKLSDYIRDERIRLDVLSESAVLHIGAGNVFTSWLPGAVISILMGYRCWIKPSAQEPVFARQWHDSVRRMDPSLADRISIVPWKDDLVRYPVAVVAYGTDEALREIRQKMLPETIFVGYGHKMSAAIVFREAGEPSDWPRWREKTVQDCELFDLNGCLSPQILYIEGKEKGPWEFLKGGVPRAPEMRTFADLECLPNDLSRFQGHLSAIGVAGPMARLDPIRSRLEALGVTRFCPLGEMQRPPLGWRNGGISLVETLDPLLQKPTGKAYNTATPVTS